MNPASFPNRYLTLPVLLAALVLPTATTIDQNGVSPESQVAVLPDTEGTISEITVNYDPILEEELDPVYEDLLRALPPDVLVRVLCPSHEAASHFVDTWGRMGPDRKIQVINVGIDVSAWARDRSIARHDPSSGDRAPSFVPAAWDVHWDYQASEIIAYWVLREAQLDLMPLTTWLRLDGGNVVSNQRHVFVSSAVFEDNSLAPRDFVLRELSRVLGRECFVVEDQLGSSPWEHVDMFLTPISDDTILVASQQLAEQLLWDAGDDPVAQAEYARLFESACSTDIVEPQLDHITDGLEAEGYRVLRLPVVFNQSENWVLTYDNVLIEQRGHHRIVYMPFYGIPPLDDMAEAVYCMEGFEVRRIDASKIFVHGGTVRCIANVTKRRFDSSKPDSLPLPPTSGLELIDAFE